MSSESSVDDAAKEKRGEKQALAPVRPQTSPDFVVMSASNEEWAVWIDCRDKWLAAKERESGSHHTRWTYATAWRQFFEWVHTSPWAVTPDHVQAWKEHMLEDLGLADTTVNLKLATLSSFYHYAATHYTIITDEGHEVALFNGNRGNPFKNVDRIKITPYKQSQHLTFEEMRRIVACIRLETAQGWRDMALLLGFFLTGRRSSEWLNLRWGDIHKGELGYWFTYRANGGQKDKAVMPVEVWQVIQCYLQAAGRWRTMTDEDYIFAPLRPELAERLGQRVEANRPITNTTANRILQKYGRRAGIPLEKCHLQACVTRRRRYELDDDLIEISKLLAYVHIAVTQLCTEPD